MMTVDKHQTDAINLDRWTLPTLEEPGEGSNIPARDDWRIESKLRQTDLRAKTSTLFRLFNGHYLAMKTHRRRKEQPEQVVDLAFVNGEPREIKDNAYGLWAVAACLLILPLAALPFVPVSPLWVALPIGVALILMMLAWRKRTHRFEFLALKSDVILFHLDALAAGEEAVDSFKNAVCRGIAVGQRRLPEGRERIPLAVAEMRRLSKEGLISNEQYENIKRNWFNG